MANLSKQRRERILKFLEDIEQNGKDDESVLSATNIIKNELTNKKYGIVWEEHSEVVEDRMETEIPIFIEEKEKEISLVQDEKYNFIIEGDNLHSLHLIEKCLKGQIDIIYIDPPYNTGAKDWRYNNDFVDKNDSYRHSKWLSFMERRLRIAKSLLSETGTLICAIDENEISHLGVLLEDIFPSKQITPVSVVHNPSGIQGKNFANNNEFLFFVYDDSIKSIAEEERDEGTADVRSFMNGAKGNSNAYLRESGYKSFYPILVKNKTVIGFGEVCDKNFHPSSRVVDKGDYLEVYPIDNDGVERKWLFARDSVEQIKDELSVRENAKTKEYTIIRTKNKINYKTVWTGSKYNAKKYGTELVKKITKTDFPFPKSLYAVMDSIKAVVHNKDDAIILDYFAGSGTLGHAVLELNKLDDGHRRFILCTNNEISSSQTLKYIQDNGYMLDYKPASTTGPDAIQAKIEDFLKEHSDVKENLFVKNAKRYRDYGICRSVTYPRIKSVVTGKNADGENIEPTSTLKDVLYEKELTLQILKNPEVIVSDIEKTIDDNKPKYTKIRTIFEDGCIKIVGTYIDNYVRIPANIKYYNTGFISKSGEQLSDRLMQYIDEMIQLEYGVKIDRDKYVSILSDEDADKLESEWSNYPNIEAIYISRKVLLTGKQRELFNTKNTYIIPDCYFRGELREAGEI